MSAEKKPGKESVFGIVCTTFFMIALSVFPIYQSALFIYNGGSTLRRDQLKELNEFQQWLNRPENTKFHRK